MCVCVESRSKSWQRWQFQCDSSWFSREPCYSLLAGILTLEQRQLVFLKS